MSPLLAPDDIQYTARITDVQEVALYGVADADLWTPLLRPHGLLPSLAAGRARVIINASALVWKGMAFRELVVTIATCTDSNLAESDSFYLAHAFNSSRILAWAERRLFGTPYAHGDIRLAIAAPLAELRQRDRVVFRARMARPDQPSTRRYDAWNGPIFLPAPDASAAGRKRFFAALSGEQTIYPFAAGVDALEIDPAEDHPIFRRLRESHFTATEWRVRTNATHARSKTYS